MDNILIGVSGGIAAYKIPELIRCFRSEGHHTQVVMTEAAKAFITPLTLQAISGQPVLDDLFDRASEAAMGHIEWARWADKIVIAPATAHVIAKLAYGLADDLLSTLCLASGAPIYVAPAMNRQMWENPATQANIALLKTRGFFIIGPGEGEQACGEWGFGRMLEPSEIAKSVISKKTNLSLSGKRVLITIGPTREPCDPVRFLSNRSSGKMGLALVQEALSLGAEVEVVAGPIQGRVPTEAACTRVETAEEMYRAVMAQVENVDIFVSAAAVADYRPAEYQVQKQKKGQETFNLTLVRNPDILKSVGELKNKPFCVGFCAETQEGLKFAREKLHAKNCDIIALNEVDQPGVGFDHPTNALTVISKESEQFLPLADKRTIAQQLWNIIYEQYQKKRTN